MATYNKVNAFVEAEAEGLHNLETDQIAVALVAAANAPTSASSDINAIPQADYTYCSSRNFTTNSSAQASGTYRLKLAELILTASGGSIGPFRYVVIYNATAAAESPSVSNIICYFDYGSEITVLDGQTLTITPDATNGLFSKA